MELSEDGRGPSCHLLQEDMTQAHQELNQDGDANQLFFLSNLITRCYLTKTILCPDRGIHEILQEFKKSIFKNYHFYLGDFLTAGLPHFSTMPHQELESADQMQQVCESLIGQLGGKIVSSKT